MPVSVKKLYCASSIEELQKKADINTSALGDKETSKLCKTAEKLLKQAEHNYKIDDEELAYVFYFKFVDLVLILKKRSDFDRQISAKYLSQSAADSLQRAMELKGSLVKRYGALKDAQQKTDDVEESSKGNDLVMDTAVEHSISVTKLLSLLVECKSSFTILDTRPSVDFEESHFKHSNCINIPSNIINPGITPQQLERLLPEASKLKWHERFKVDHIVLIDWDTTDTCLPSGHPLRSLEEAMCKWDSQTPLEKPPLILIGGYKEWILRYPMHCTKALNVISLDTPEEVSCITDVSDIDFPDFDEATNDESTLVMDKNIKNAGFNKNSINNSINTPLVNRQSKPREQMSNVFSKITELDTPFKVTDRPNSNVDISSVKFFQPANSDLSKEIVKVIPEVNRNLKPSKLSTSDKEPLSQEVNFKIHYSASEEAKEFEFSKLRLRKKLEAEESMRIELQKQEEKLLEKMKFMELEKQENDAKCTALKEENERVKKLLAVTNVEQDKNEKDLKEHDLLEEKLHQKKRKLPEHEIGSDSDIKLSNGTHSLCEKEKDPGKDMSTGEHTVSLKKSETSCDNITRGLTRSYSSPNIAQLDSVPFLLNHRKKLPSVDRSLKPKIDMLAPVSDSQLRIRTLNPIYGNCPARPVTGLRNLGNTCFMNSIIQCLSNTERIANYFTTEQYRHHVRRNNRQGSNGEVAEEFAVVIRALHAGTFKSIYPKDLKNTLSRYIPMCAGCEQQDAHEFFLALYEQLHGDLNQGYDGDPLPDLDSFSESTVKIEKFWNHHRSQNRSKLSETFEGLLESTLLCLSCRKTSHTYEVFSCLSLPIPSSKYNLKIQDCFTSFLKSEKMSGEGAWYCPACKQKKEAEKILSICKLPNVLIIQLKRFCYDGMWKKKRMCPVEFRPLLEIQPGKIYELYSIVQHFGCLEGGHYTASCKNALTGQWYKYDDHEVSEINLNDIQMSSAYLLFYTAHEKK